MKRLIWIVLALAIAALIYFLVSGKEEEVLPASPAVYDSTYLKIGVLPTSECLPFLVGAECGIADSAGLKLHVVKYDAAMDADTAFQNGTVDGVISDMVKLSVLESQGYAVRAVMGGDVHLSLLTTRQSRITEAKNLKEKIVSITRHSVVDMYADKLLSSVKLESYELNKPQINSIPVRYGMLCQNEYDGAILPEPWASMSEKHGCHRLSGSLELPGMEKQFVVLFPDSVIERRKVDIQKLIKVYNLSVDYINKYRKTEIKKLLGMLDIKEEHNDSILGNWTYEHAAAASEGSLSTARSWSRDRKILGKETRESVIDKSFTE